MYNCRAFIDFRLRNRVRPKAMNMRAQQIGSPQHEGTQPTASYTGKGAKARECGGKGENPRGSSQHILCASLQAFCGREQGNPVLCWRIKAQVSSSRAKLAAGGATCLANVATSLSVRQLESESDLFARTRDTPAGICSTPRFNSILT